jgi:hypothetical protein
MSTDGGLTWSTPEKISGNAPGLCFFGDFFNGGAPNDCNFDQGSYSVALPNGDLQVVFSNGNTAAGNPNAQILGVHCHPTGSSAAGTAHFNCATPTKVGDDVVVGEPQCDFGRGPEECIPGAYIRTNDFPRITKDNTQNNHVYTVWQDYRNGEFDIQLSQSTDGGLTWHEAGTVNPDRGLDHLRCHRPGANNGEINGSGDRNGAATAQRAFGRETSVSCLFELSPPDCAVPPRHPAGRLATSRRLRARGAGAATFWRRGDLARSARRRTASSRVQRRLQRADRESATGAPIWCSAREPFPLNGVVRDEDIFTDKVGLPDGHGHRGQGVIGKSLTRKSRRH